MFPSGFLTNKSNNNNNDLKPSKVETPKSSSSKNVVPKTASTKKIAKIDLSFLFNSENTTAKVIYKLKLDQKEGITLETFENLIQEYQSKNKPYVVALTKTRLEGHKRFYHGYDGMSLYNHLKTKETNPLNNEKMKTVLYFGLYPGHENFEYVGSNKGTAASIEFLEHFIEAINTEDAKEQLLIAIRYQEGNGITQNDKLAAMWCKKAADQGLAYAQYLLGFCYHSGQGVEKNEKLEAEWFQKSADQGNELAQHQLGICYRDGIGVDKDPKKAFELFQESAKKDYSIALRELAICYDYGIGTLEDEQAALKYYLKAAEHADHAGNMASNHLGYLYMNGHGCVQKDAKEGFKWYKKAADQGDARAQYHIAHSYFHGVGVDENESEAFKYFEKSAKQGYATAQYMVGICYKKGMGVPKDKNLAETWLEKAGPGEAFKWNKLAADQEKNPLGQYNVAMGYLEGKGVAKDESKAVEYFEKSANQKHANSQYMLAICYDRGLGVTQDKKKALEWYTIAGENGSRDAQSYLGEYYWKTLGNIDKGRYWYEKGVAQLSEDEKKAILDNFGKTSK